MMGLSAAFLVGVSFAAAPRVRTLGPELAAAPTAGEAAVHKEADGAPHCSPADVAAVCEVGPLEPMYHATGQLAVPKIADAATHPIQRC